MEEMLDLAANGSKILHLRCVEYARRYGIPIHVRSSWSQKPGTWIKDNPYEGEGAVEAPIIAGIAHDRSEAKITIVGVPDRVGIAAKIFGAIAEAGLNIDMIVQNVSAAETAKTDISFTLPKADGPEGDVGAPVDQARGRVRRPALRRRRSARSPSSAPA